MITLAKPSRRLRLALDIDGVCCDFVAAFNDWVHSRTGQTRLPATRWDWYVDYDRGSILWKEFWWWIPTNDELEDAAGIDGSSRTSELRTKCDIAFVTHRPAEALPLTRRWITMQFGIDNPTVITVADKSWVDADIWVDDHGPTVDALVASGRDAFVFDQPWNQDSLSPRLRDWHELADLVIARAGQ